MRYEDASGSFQASGPNANDDSDTLPAGSRQPATGNLITGEGTQYAAAGADSAAGGHITSIAGKGGEDSSFSGGKLSVTGEHGNLSVDAEGNYSYIANKNAPENVRDRFTYTLADNQGNTDTAALVIELGKTPVVIKADAQQIVPGPDGVVTLPPGVELSDVMVVGRNLVINMPDGTQLIIVDGAVFVPQLVLDGVQVPATNVAALLIGQEPQPAAGELPPSSGGNFAVPPPPLDPGVPLGDLIPPTVRDYVPPEPQETFLPLDNEPEIFVQPDGQPATINAVDQVEEAGLPTRNGGEPAGSAESADGNGSNNSATGETTTGNIVYTSEDTPNVITINGVAVASVGQVIAGSFGSLTITSIAPGVIGYSYTLNDNTSGNDTHDDFAVQLTDSDGDIASATLRIDIIDDVPTARPDTDLIPAGEFGPATGNVITDAAPGDVGDTDTNAADTVGADNARVTFIDHSNAAPGASVPNGGFVDIAGQYGVLRIYSNGDYSYTRNEGTPGGVTEVFNYTLTDGDGDTSVSTLTISIGDLKPETDENPPVQLDDDALANGNPGGDGDDADAVNVTGFLAASGGDGPLVYDLLLTGAPAGFSYVDGPNGSVHVMQGTTHVLTITINTSTGAYEVTQVNPIDHSAGGAENNVDFDITYRVTDQDGDSADGTLHIDVDDDTPVVNVELNREGAVTVDESGPTGASTIVVGGGVTEGDDENVAGSGPIGRAVGTTAVVNASALFGADGPSGSGLTYSLQLGGSDTPLTLTDGSAIELQLINGVIVGVVTEGPHDGEAAFAIAIDPATGVATVELYLSLDHPDVSNPNDSLPLGPNTVAVVVSATDGDGDTDTSDPVDISGLFNFLDDGPTAGGEVNAEGAVTTDESGPTGASTIVVGGGVTEGDDENVAGSGPIGRAVGAAAVVDANAAFGADGPSGDDFSYALQLGSSDTPLTLTDGSAIELQLIDGVIVGVVTEGAHDGEAAFAIAIDPVTGVATVELYLSLDHPLNPNPNDSLPLGPNTVSVVVTATDGDGDTDASDPIDISALFNFLDDGPSVNPSVNAQAVVNVDESLPSNVPGIDTPGVTKGNDPDLSDATGTAIGQGNSGVAIVNANAVFGADGPAALNSITYALSVTNVSSGVTLTDGTAINLQLLANGVIVGVVAAGTFAGQAAFAISINSTTGVVTVEQYLSLDHPVNPDPNDVLGLGDSTIAVTVTATDGDGDPVTSGAVDISDQISFFDDGPSADPVLDQEATISVDESLPSSVPAIDTLAVVKGNDPDLSDATGTAIGAGNSGSAIIDVNAFFGADGPAAGGGISYELSIINASSGVTLTDGSAINLQLLANGVVVGVVASGTFAGQAAFAIAINPTTGVVSLEQYLSLDHPINPDPNDALGLGENTLGVKATVTDGDGDPITTGAVDISSNITFRDDGPSVNPAVNAQAVVSLDESLPSSVPAINTLAVVKGNDPDLSDATGTAIGQGNSGVAIVNANAVFGADGPAALNSITYALSVTNVSSGVTLTDGTAINLQLLANGVIVGVVAAGTFAGQAAFAISINSTTGVVTVEQYLSLDHPVNPDPNDVLGLGDSTIAVTVTATDGDGDPVTSGAIDISDQISFFDDGPSVNPTVNAQAVVTVDETLPSSVPAIATPGVTKGNDPDLSDATGTAIGQGNSGVAIVNANAVFGADGAAALNSITYALSVTNVSSGVTLTDGTAINLQLLPNGVIVGVVAAGTFAGQAAFAIAINPTTGVVTVEQYLSLDHPVNPDPNDPLGLGDSTIAVTVTATDGDGDPVTSGAVDISDQITFLDDGPSATPAVSTEAPAVVDESPPVSDPTINTDPYVKGDDPDLVGGQAIASGSTTLLVPNAFFGADGPAAVGAITYHLTVNNASSGLTLTDGSAINLVLLPSGVVVGVVQAGPFAGQAAFAISLNANTGVVTAELYLSLDHPTNPDPNDILTLAAGSLGATVTITDGDGDTFTSGSLDVGSRIQFYDDGPSASNEAQQNVQEGFQTVTGTFDFVAGADGGGVTHINGIQLVFGVGGFSQWIPVDDGQIRAKADGSYEFQSDASGSGVTNGTFTVTDGDGDPVTANWAFNITDANVPTAGTSAARLDDDGLAGNNPASSTGDIDANVGELAPANSNEAIFHGQLTLNFGGDGPGTVTFAAMNNLTGTVGTETVRYTWAGSTLTATVEGGPRNGTVLFDIVVNQTTGEYTLTLRDNVIHAAGGNETSAPNVPLTYTVTDSDNSPAGGVNGTLNIEFNDDAPTLSNVVGASGVTLDETSAGTPAGFPISNTSAAAMITATQAFGADGAAAVNSVVYGLAITGGPGTGLFTTAGNFAITLVQVDANTIEGRYNGSNVAFTIDIGTDGRVTLTQNVALNHTQDGGPALHNDALDLTGLVNATITITDGDGDTAPGSAPIGDDLVFLDDGPDAQADVNATLDQLVLDETRPLGTETNGDSAPAGLGQITADFSNNFVGPADYGADGAGAVTYSLSLSGSNVGSGLYALDQADITAGDGDGIGRGAEIVLNISGDGLTITGTVGATPYFTISINPTTGVVTFTQLLNVWHANTGSDDDTSTLTTAAAANVQVVQRVTDADGDFDTATVSVGQGVFHIEDDGPEFTAPPAGVEVENGDTTVQIENLNLEIGSDGYGLLFFNSAHDGDPAQDADGHNLTFGGEQLFYQVNGNVLTAETADGDVGFTITLNQNGTYSFQLHGVISNGTETSFTDLTSAAAGNVAFRLVGSDVGNNNAENTDLILSGNGTVNTNSTSMGVNNQSMESGERIRIDFVENLETVVGPGDPPNGPQGFHHSGHVTTTHFEQLIAQTNGNPDTVVDMRVTAILADEDNVYENTPSVAPEVGESIADITSVTINFAIGVSHTFDPNVPASLSFLHTNADGSGTTTTSVTFNADGSVSIFNLQEGDQYEIDTSDPFSAVVNQSLEPAGGGSYDLGILSIGSVSSGDPILQDFDIVAQDRDGDQEAATISTAINPPVDTLAATFSSFASQEQQVQKIAANSNTLTLATAVAAAGFVEPVAAHDNGKHNGNGHNVEAASHAAPETVMSYSVDDSGDAAVSMLAPEVSSKASAPADTSSSSSDHSSSSNSLDDSAAKAAPESNDAPAADDGGSHSAADAANPVAPTVAMVSAEALEAAANDGGNAQKGGSVEQIVAEALQDSGSDVDAALANLPGGNGGLQALAHMASLEDAGVSAWHTGGHAAGGAALDMMMKMDVSANHHDAVQPVHNG
ncbi:DUF5801 domain-containing protein [Sphingomonas sp. NSE70-1]|uniref:DUF5801 domain-containing protein n=1 Tax=Sphingomonas caseinilyticus TaxID=2908205 RepID=A0ABT0RUD6_9SPHN|nr:DUF5801 repeats-in-toxin domain-containing protein [Sphingomonas caseinilyticus]MCL6698541.1 DUF5801 domain-containing protein [Sphingomonas caseinilyticus]